MKFHCGLLRLWLRQPELVREHAAQVLHIVQQYDFPLWRALGTCLLGMADAQLGRAEEGLTPDLSDARDLLERDSVGWR